MNRIGLLVDIRHPALCRIGLLVDEKQPLLREIGLLVDVFHVEPSTRRPFLHIAAIRMSTRRRFLLKTN